VKAVVNYEAAKDIDTHIHRCVQPCGPSPECGQPCAAPLHNQMRSQAAAAAAELGAGCTAPSGPRGRLRCS